MSIAADACIPANKNLALNSIIGASFGGMYQAGLSKPHLTNEMLAAGQRCMALSVGQQILIGHARFKLNFIVQSLWWATHDHGFRNLWNVLQS